MASPTSALSTRETSRGKSAEAPVTGHRKAAILLTSIGDESSAAILRQLTEPEIHEITREISLLGKLKDRERQEILEEFLQAAENPANLNAGGIEYATSVLLNAFGPDTGKRMADRLLKSMKQDASTVESFRKADPQNLAKVVAREHPQTIALILSNLDGSNAAKLLGALPEALRPQIVRRMAMLDQVSPEVMNRLARIIDGKLRILGESTVESSGGVRAVAELLNRMDPATSDSILQEIGNDDEPLRQDIRQLMFVFEDLVNLSEASLRKLLGKVDRKVLTMALKGSSPQIRKQFTALMSSRAAEMLMEDMQALGPVRIRDVQEAQQALIATARQMQEAGEITLQTGGGEDEFVE
jgi:flagellar motor switch protein FliG